MDTRGSTDRCVRFLRGATRVVVLFGDYAVKLPRPTTWRTFLNGLLANMQEREFSRTKWPELCPVLASFPGGWLLVMRRAVPLSDAEWHDVNSGEWPEHGEYIVPVEMKRDSFGVIDGRIVAVDYGT